MLERPGVNVKPLHGKSKSIQRTKGLQIGGNVSTSPANADHHDGPATPIAEL
jgi:hypothetical protein